MTTDEMNEIKKAVQAAGKTDWSALATALAPAFAAAAQTQGIVIQVNISADTAKELASVVKAGIAR